MTLAGRRAIGVGIFVVLGVLLLWWITAAMDRQRAAYERNLKAHDAAMLAACVESGGRPVFEPSPHNFSDWWLRLSLCVPDGVGAVDLGRRER